MEEVLQRLAQLENEVAVLKASKKEYPFTSFENIVLEKEDLDLVYTSSLFEHIIRVIVAQNNLTPFIKNKKKLCKYEDGWIPITDNDIVYMVKHVEKLFIDLHIKSSAKYSSDEFFDKVDIIYGFKINIKKIRSELLNSI
jgi:hypothetical protein